MPLEKCTVDGKNGYKWGKRGKCYTGKNAKKKAIKQGYAINPEEVKQYLSSQSSVSDEDLCGILLWCGASLFEVAAVVYGRKLSRKEINDLPDSDFAYIEPGGKKDSEGKTVPRSLRHFPISDEARVRNAIARLPQSKLSMSAKKKAFKKILKAAKKFGIKVSEEVIKKYK